MNRRLVKLGCCLEASREVRPTETRHFESGAVVNILQSITSDTARFTIEGEGAEIWCCAQALFDRDTKSCNLSNLK
jgi:hypothetical protein